MIGRGEAREGQETAGGASRGPFARGRPPWAWRSDRRSGGCDPTPPAARPGRPASSAGRRPGRTGPSGAAGRRRRGSRRHPHPRPSRPSPSSTPSTWRGAPGATSSGCSSIRITSPASHGDGEGAGPVVGELEQRHEPGGRGAAIRLLEGRVGPEGPRLGNIGRHLIGEVRRCASRGTTARPPAQSAERPSLAMAFESTRWAAIGWSARRASARASGGSARPTWPTCWPRSPCANARAAGSRSSRGEHPADEARTEGLVRAEHPTGERPLEGGVHSDDPREEPRRRTPSGTNPRRANTNPNLAVSLASRMSIGRVIVAPTPTAGPLIAAITAWCSGRSEG